MHSDTSNGILNAKFISKGSENMGDQLGARISSMEHIQKEFGHEIREIKKELARLAKLIESRTEAVTPRPEKGRHVATAACL